MHAQTNEMYLNLFSLLQWVTLQLHISLYCLISSKIIFYYQILGLKSELEFVFEISVILTATISDIPSLSVRSQQLYTPSID